jgi:hypothetical protein
MLPNRIRICKLLSDNDDTFLVEKEGKRIGSWPGNSYLAETEDFEVLQGDLDDDQHPELIIANHDSTSVGMAVNFWTIFIFADPEFRKFRPPLTFSVQEYGSSGTFVSRNGRIRILTTRWLWSSDPKRKRAEGLYLVGQWWRYKAGNLLPLSRLTPVARRYLMSFENERSQTVNSPLVPYKWLSNAKAEILKHEPIIETKREEKTGLIVSVSMAPGNHSQRSVKIVFRPNNAPPVVYTYPEEPSNPEKSLRYIGDARSGRIYPESYLPSNPEVWLTGKRATLATYGEKVRSESLEVLWIER